MSSGRLELASGQPGNRTFGKMKGLQDVLRPEASAQSETQAMEDEAACREDTIVTWKDLIHRPEVGQRKGALRVEAWVLGGREGRKGV